MSLNRIAINDVTVFCLQSWLCGNIKAQECWCWSTYWHCRIQKEKHSCTIGVPSKYCSCRWVYFNSADVFFIHPLQWVIFFPFNCFLLFWTSNCLPQEWMLTSLNDQNIFQIIILKTMIQNHPIFGSFYYMHLIARCCNCCLTGHHIPQGFWRSMYTQMMAIMPFHWNVLGVGLWLPCREILRGLTIWPVISDALTKLFIHFPGKHVIVDSPRHS